jgi:hypothetical protein
VKRFLILLVALAAGIAAAAFSISSNAASVNGVGISRSTLNSDLTAIGQSAAYQCYLRDNEVLQTSGAGTLPPLYGVGGVSASWGVFNGTFNTTFVDTWLDQLLTDETIHQLVAQRGLTVTSDDLAVARTATASIITSDISQAENQGGSTYTCSGTGAQILAAMPASFVDRQVQAQADTDALLASAAGYGLGQSQLQRYFEAHQGDFDTICLSGIVTASPAAADAAAAKLAAGTSFADVAKSDSTDTSSAANGGVLGCAVASETTLGTDVAKLPVGGVTAPLSENGSYLILQLTKRTAASSFASALPAVRQAVLSAGETKAGTLLRKVVATADITVDSRYGTWAKTTIAPPSKPPVTSLLSPVANVPTASSVNPATSAAG